VENLNQFYNSWSHRFLQTINFQGHSMASKFHFTDVFNFLWLESKTRLPSSNQILILIRIYLQKA